MFKWSVQEGWQNRNRLALGICFSQPRRAHQISVGAWREVRLPAPTVAPTRGIRVGLFRRLPRRHEGEYKHPIQK